VTVWYFWRALEDSFSNVSGHWKQKWRIKSKTSADTEHYAPCNSLKGPLTMMSTKNTINAFICTVPCFMCTLHLSASFCKFWWKWILGSRWSRNRLLSIKVMQINNHDGHIWCIHIYILRYYIHIKRNGLHPYAFSITKHDSNVE